MKGNLKIKERRFLDKYLEGKSLAICAKYAGYEGKHLRDMGYRVLKSLDISLQETLEMNGLTDEYMTQKALEGLNSKKVVVATFQGRIGEEKAYADHPTRAKYLELLGRMKGSFIDKLELAGKDGGDIILAFKSTKGKNKRAIALD